jgi:hypothetical protein
MEHAKVIRGKTLGAWKKYAEENYSNTPPQVLKYIIVLEEELSKLSQHDVSKSFYCLGDSFGESGKCDKQCEDCKAKILKQ